MADRIEQIEERLAKATPGMQADDGGAIWIDGVVVETHYVSRDMALDAEEPSMEGMPMEEQRQEQQQIGQMERTEDAAFVANAPSDLRYLLDALRESREELEVAVRLLDDIDGAMSLGSVRRGVALMQDVAQADWVFGTLKKIRAYLAARHPEPVEEEPNG